MGSTRPRGVRPVRCRIDGGGCRGGSTSWESEIIATSGMRKSSGGRGGRGNRPSLSLRPTTTGLLDSDDLIPSPPNLIAHCPSSLFLKTIVNQHIFFVLPFQPRIFRYASSVLLLVQYFVLKIEHAPYHCTIKCISTVFCLYQGAFWFDTKILPYQFFGGLNSKCDDLV